jgi:hypothetical protein
MCLQGMNGLGAGGGRALAQRSVPPPLCRSSGEGARVGDGVQELSYRQEERSLLTINM